MKIKHVIIVAVVFFGSIFLVSTFEYLLEFFKKEPGYSWLIIVSIIGVIVTLILLFKGKGSKKGGKKEDSRNLHDMLETLKEIKNGIFSRTTEARTCRPKDSVIERWYKDNVY